MFCFGGRQPNLELQLPFIHRILEQHPDVEYHLWNLARTPSDYRWIRSLRYSKEPRFKVHNVGYSPNPWTKFNEVYQHYADPLYKGCLFVKLDDDIVFLETAQFVDLIQTIDKHRHAVISAQVINNGACTRTLSGLWQKFRSMRPPIKLLDVHRHPRFAALAHQWFLDNWEMLVDAPTGTLTPTRDWLSINLIGYDWEMAGKIAGLLGTESPPEIAGRRFGRNSKLGDEGLVNTLPRIIFQGFIAAHLYFGPQLKAGKEPMFEEFRRQYAEVGEKYLASW